MLKDKEIGQEKPGWDKIDGTASHTLDSSSASLLLVNRGPWHWTADCQGTRNISRGMVSTGHGPKSREGCHVALHFQAQSPGFCFLSQITIALSRAAYLAVHRRQHDREKQRIGALWGKVQGVWEQICHR